MRVFVYFNLHRKLFSIKALEGPNKGRVIGHSDDVTLTDVCFKVSEAGRQRVIREKRKNVHAGAVGRLDSAACLLTVAKPGGVPLTYNPYRFSSFVRLETSEPVKTARMARLQGKRIIAWGEA